MIAAAPLVFRATTSLSPRQCWAEMTCFPADPTLLCLLSNLALARDEPLPLHQYVLMKEDFQPSEPKFGAVPAMNSRVCLCRWFGETVLLSLSNRRAAPGAEVSVQPCSSHYPKGHWEKTFFKESHHPEAFSLFFTAHTGCVSSGYTTLPIWRAPCF